MGIAKDMQIEEMAADEIERAEELKCPACGNERDEVGSSDDPYLVCGHCEDKEREAEDDKYVTLAENYIPGEFDAEELAEDKRIADAENGDLPQI